MSTPRRGGSRPSVRRPRKLAGRRSEEPVDEVRGAPAEDPVVEVRGAPAEDPVVEVRGAPAPSLETSGDPSAAEGGSETGASAPSSTTDEPVVEVRGAPAPSLETSGGDGCDGPSTTPTSTGGAGSRRTTWILVAVVVVLAAVGVGEIVYLNRDPEPTVSAARPVVTGELTHRSAVEAAARATEQILSTSYQDYDAQVEKATEQMTETFAEEYRTTSDGIKEQFVEQRTKLQVKAVAQGVVQASRQQVQALLFLNQYVEKVQDGAPATAYAQYRALVTVVRTGHGWLVSDIETK